MKTLVPITWPLESPWTTDLFGLLDEALDLGEGIEKTSDEAVLRLSGTDNTARVEEPERS